MFLLVFRVRGIRDLSYRHCSSCDLHYKHVSFYVGFFHVRGIRDLSEGSWRKMRLAALASSWQIMLRMLRLPMILDTDKQKHHRQIRDKALLLLLLLLLLSTTTITPPTTTTTTFTATATATATTTITTATVFTIIAS